MHVDLADRNCVVIHAEGALLWKLDDFDSEDVCSITLYDPGDACRPHTSCVIYATRSQFQNWAEELFKAAKR